MADPRGSDSRSGARTNDAPPAESHNPFHGLWDKTTHALGTAKDAVVHGGTVAKDKIVETANDPKVQAHVKHGVEIGGRMGKGVINGVAQDGKDVARDAQNGNVGGVLEKVAPIILTGGASVVVKEVAPHVVREGMKELPSGAREKIQGNAVGNMVLRQAERGNIPTSPTDIGHMVIRNAKDQAVRGAVTGVRDHVAGTAQQGREQQQQGRERQTGGAGAGSADGKYESRSGAAGAAGRDAKYESRGTSTTERTTTQTTGTASGARAEATTAKPNVVNGTSNVGSWLNFDKITHPTTGATDASKKTKQ